jgi:hypothetical protein
MKKLTLQDVEQAHQALNIIYKYKGAKLNDVDFTAIFKKQPTKAQLKLMEAATAEKTFIQAIIMFPERWAKEFKTELTPEFQKYLKKIRAKQK